MTFSLTGKRVWVAGHAGMVGSALMRRLAYESPTALLGASRAELDLRDAAAVERWVQANRPQAVFVSAARVGGILANQQQPAEFLHDNLLIAANTIHAAWRGGVEKLVYVASAAMYPLDAPQPIMEDSLMTGLPDPSHDGYAIAKIAAVRMCQTYRRQYGADFIAAVPCNLYGPGDRFGPESSHVTPALLHKAHVARTNGAAEMTVWGSGRPRRELLFVDDCADALVHLIKTYSGERPVNVGSGEDLTIAELAQAAAEVAGFAGVIRYDADKPDGAMRRLMSSDTLRSLGWRPTTTLETGLARTYAAYLAARAPA